MRQSRLSKKTLLPSGTRFSFYRHHEKDLFPFIAVGHAFVFCVGIKGVFDAMVCVYQSAPKPAIDL